MSCASRAPRSSPTRSRRTSTRRGARFAASSLLVRLLREGVVEERGGVDLVVRLDVPAERRIRLAVLDVHLQDVQRARRIDDAVRRHVALRGVERLDVQTEVVTGYRLWQLASHLLRRRGREVLVRA